jgi:hypothetical protein
VIVKVIHPAPACLQASARRSSKDGFGSVVGSRIRQSSQSPLSPPTSGPNTSVRQSHMSGASENDRLEDPSSPMLQPKSTPLVTQTPTLGTGDQGLTYHRETLAAKAVQPARQWVKP